MVAYGFNKRFVGPIRTGEKAHTIRLPRKRHAYPGEQLQLYRGMRQKSCFKIRPDVTCTRVDIVSIATSSIGMEAIAINGIVLTQDEMEALALADGFRLRPDYSGKDALHAMGYFWRSIHTSQLSGVHVFEGVMIAWGQA